MEIHLAFYPCIPNNVYLPPLSRAGTPRSPLTLLVLQGFVSSAEEEQELWGGNPALLRGYSLLKRSWDVHAFVHSQKKGNLEGIPVLLTPLLSRSFLQQELLENTSAEQSPKGHWQQIIPFLALDNLWGRLEACAGHKSLAAHIDSWGISVSSLSTPNNYHRADFRKCLFPWDASI